MGVPVNSGAIWLAFSLLYRMAKHPHDLVARDLDQATAAKGLDEGGCLVDQRAQVGRLDLPAPGQLADQQLRTSGGHHSVAVQALSCPLLPPPRAALVAPARVRWDVEQARRCGL